MGGIFLDNNEFDGYANADGVNDLLMGSPGDDMAGEDAGVVFVLYGGLSSEEIPHTADDLAQYM